MVDGLELHPLNKDIVLLGKGQVKIKILIKYILFIYLYNFIKLGWNLYL